MSLKVCAVSTNRRWVRPIVESGQVLRIQASKVGYFLAGIDEATIEQWRRSTLRDSMGFRCKQAVLECVSNSDRPIGSTEIRKFLEANDYNANTLNRALRELVKEGAIARYDNNVSRLIRYGKVQANQKEVA